MNYNYTESKRKGDKFILFNTPCCAGGEGIPHAY